MFFKKIEIINCIRNFFYINNFLELNNFSLSEKIIPESNIDTFKIKDNNKYYRLLPSPEYYIKIFLSEYRNELTNYKGIFEICNSFRSNEINTGFHLNEFTILEYYYLNHNYMSNLELTKDLFNYLINKKLASKDIFQNFLKISVKDLFKKYLNIDLDKIIEISYISFDKAYTFLLKEIKHLDIYISKDENFISLYEKLFVKFIEIRLKEYNYIAIYDFPYFINTLSKQKNGYNERWELYLKGIEISNCFTEENDIKQIEKFFDKEIKNMDKTDFIDLDYSKKIKSLPNCSGNAVGIDRLAMVILNLKDINELNLTN